MAATQKTATRLYTCPNCDGTLVFDRGWTCEDCRYTPRQSAD